MPAHVVLPPPLQCVFGPICLHVGTYESLQFGHVLTMLTRFFTNHRRCKQTCKLVLACPPLATEDSLFAVCGRREVNFPGVQRQQESRDTGNWTLELGGGADIWWEVGVVRGGLMVKQRGAHIPWCLLCAQWTWHFATWQRDPLCLHQSGLLI